MVGIHRLAASAGALVLAGCASLTPQEFDAHIRRAVLIGTPIPTAITILEKEGLACKRVEAQECTAERQRVGEFLERTKKELRQEACTGGKYECGWETHVQCHRPPGFTFGLPPPPDRVKLKYDAEHHVASLSTYRSPSRYAIEAPNEFVPVLTKCEGMSPAELMELRRKAYAQRKPADWREDDVTKNQ